jgi:hypothetical protein
MIIVLIKVRKVQYILLEFKEILRKYRKKIQIQVKIYIRFRIKNKNRNRIKIKYI